jgi:hypothetical protein
MAAEEFSPADHTVDEVNAYLAQADPAEVARVLAAESEADSPRKGIVEGPHAAVVEAAEAEDLLGDADPYELVRARSAVGFEYSTTRIAALNAGSTVLDHKSATDEFGRLVPTKSVLDLRAEAAAAEGQPSPISEEN